MTDDQFTYRARRILVGAMRVVSVGFGIYYFIASVDLVFVTYFGNYPVGYAPDPDDLWRSLIRMLIYVLAYVGLWYLAPFLARAALPWGMTKCPKCRYDLEGLRGDVCPECGLVLGTNIVDAPVESKDDPP